MGGRYYSHPETDEEREWNVSLDREALIEKGMNDEELHLYRMCGFTKDRAIAKLKGKYKREIPYILRCFHYRIRGGILARTPERLEDLNYRALYKVSLDLGKMEHEAEDSRTYIPFWRPDAKRINDIIKLCRDLEHNGFNVDREMEKICTYYGIRSGWSLTCREVERIYRTLTFWLNHGDPPYWSPERGRIPWPEREPEWWRSDRDMEDRQDGRGRTHTLPRTAEARAIMEDMRF